MFQHVVAYMTQSKGVTFTLPSRICEGTTLNPAASASCANNDFPFWTQAATSSLLDRSQIWPTPGGGGLDSGLNVLFTASATYGIRQRAPDIYNRPFVVSSDIMKSIWLTKDLRHT